MSTGRIIHGTQLTGKTNWYTPSKFAESARKVMGSIDLDPASCEFANRSIMATAFYDEQTDGLKQSWHGNVWLNPPYKSAAMLAFVEKLTRSIQSGSVKNAVLLTHNNTDTTWFHKAVRLCEALCFTRGRVRFYDENGSANSPTHGHTFMFFSSEGKPKTSAFIKEFSKYGFCLKAV